MARIGGCLMACGLLWAGPAIGRDGGIVLAQRITAGAANEARQEDQYLDVLKQLRSQCDNAGWSLWRSNSYERWRQRKSPIIHMHYSAGSYPNLPAPPQGWPEALRGRLEPTLKRANDLLKESGAAFKQLADYINAKDYEDDKFKKGDELNAKLVEYGQACHRLFAEMTDLYTEAAGRLIEARRNDTAKPDVVATMVDDWHRARPLSQELAKFDKADPAKLEALVREISTLTENRKANYTPLKDNPDTWVRRFYENSLNDSIAIKMRRLLRETKDPKLFQAKAEDRPRSDFWTVRSEIDVSMPDTILRAIQYGR